MNGPLLLTPGPLSTAPATRAAMARDWGARDPEFIALVARIRARVAGLCDTVDPMVCVPIQGSGTFAVEATLGTLVPAGGRVLVLVNGAYGRRMAETLERQGRIAVVHAVHELEPIDPTDVHVLLEGDPELDFVAIVHCETTTGVLNPVAEISNVVRHHGRALIVDSMSAFGALSLEGVSAAGVVSSADKCLEGVPGLALALLEPGALSLCGGRAPSLALDLHDQWVRFERDGQWRFSPPTHAVAALDAALQAHEDEGGVPGRGARYRENLSVLTEGMARLGFVSLVEPAHQAPVVLTLAEPVHPNWRFCAVYDALVERGFAICPGMLARAPSFRVGCVGHVFPDDLRRFVGALAAVMGELGVPDGAPGSDT